MPLTIEDGTGVAGANSYADVTGARAYATARGLTLPVADADIEALLILAMDFIEAHRSQFQGVKTASTNPLQFPRTGVSLDGYELADSAIPQILKDAQAQLAIDAVSSSLMPTGTGREVIKEKVDVIEVSYATSGNTNTQPIFTKAVAMLRPLLKSGLFGELRSLRV